MQLEMELSFSEKFCTHCREWLSVEMFGLNSRTTDNLHHWCKPCINAGNRDYKSTPEGKLSAKLARDRYNRRAMGEVIPRPRPKRSKEGEDQPKTPKQWVKHYREENIAFLRTIKTRIGCQVCGEDDPICLDFHHRDPKEKDFNLARNTNAGRPTSVMVNEIMKCAVLCSNCHRKVHSGSIDVVNLPLLTSELIGTLVNVDNSYCEPPQLGG